MCHGVYVLLSSLLCAPNSPALLRYRYSIQVLNLCFLVFCSALSIKRKSIFGLQLLFNKYLFNAYYLASIVLGPTDTTRNSNSSLLSGAYVPS